MGLLFQCLDGVQRRRIVTVFISTLPGGLQACTSSERKPQAGVGSITADEQHTETGNELGSDAVGRSENDSKRRQK